MEIEVIYNIFLSFFIVFIGTILIGGIFLLYRANKTKLNNLFLIGAAFILISMGLIGNLIFKLGIIFQQSFIFFSYVLVTLFTNVTFHKNLKTPSKKILIIIIALGMVVLIFQVLLLILFIPLTYYLKLSFDVVFNILTFNWLAWSSYTAYKRIKNQDIPPWIKVRYKMISFFSFLLSLNVVPQLFQPWNVRWGDPTNILSLIVFGIMAINAIIFSIVFSITWVMPEFLKNFFNKGYHPIKIEDLSEEKLMELIKKELAEGG